MSEYSLLLFEFKFKLPETQTSTLNENIGG